MATTNSNVSALSSFRSLARKQRPTQQHRAALWENMLGTVYAQNAAGEIRYFDYDYAAAIQFIGEIDDVRVARYSSDLRMGARADADYQHPRVGQLVWFVKSVTR